MKEKIQNNSDSVIRESFFESATDEQKVRALNIIIDRELEKPENEVDMELIKSCMNTIENIHGGVRERSNKELNENLNRITSSKQKRRYTLFTFRHFVKVASIMLVVMLALGMTITTMARAAGYSNAYDWIKDNMSYDVDGITVIKGNETNRYESVEDFMKEENIDILYPSSLPEGVVLQTVVVTEYGDGKYAVIFQYNSNNISISIYNFDLYLSDIPEPNETIKIGEYEYTITYLSKNSYQANCIIDQYAYTIISSDYNDLISIINSMKGK